MAGSDAPRWPGLLVLLVLALHAYAKYRLGVAWEMLWSCHVASALIAVGILARAPRPTAVGLLFHLAMGIPAYLLDAIATLSTTPTSILGHLVPALCAWPAVRRLGYPRLTLLSTWAFYLALQPLSYLLTPPDLNVNVAFAPWPPLAGVFQSPWAYRVFNAAMALLFLSLGDLALRRWRKDRAPAPAPEEPR